MNPINENYENLLSLWHLYGANQLDSEFKFIWHNSDWPKRCWLEDSKGLRKLLAKEDFYTQISQTLSKLTSGTTFSIFNCDEISSSTVNVAISQILTEAGFRNNFNQTAMHLPLADWIHTNFNSELSIQDASSNNQFDEWAAIGSDAFGYHINSKIVSRVSNRKNVRCLLVDYQGSSAATALLYQTGNTMGVHQVAVRPAYQGKGIARHLMTALINHCQEDGIKSIVLQASEAGKPLYQSLGFEDLFGINNYQLSTT